MIYRNIWQQRVVIQQELVYRNYDYKALFTRTRPEEFTARIYKKLREKNKNEKNNNDNIKDKLTTNLKEKLISIEE